MPTPCDRDGVEARKDGKRMRFRKQIRRGVRAGALAAAGAALLIVAVPRVQSAPPHGKVAPWDAMAAAVAKVPGGRAYSATYALEEGRWIYDVIVLQGKSLTEVEVDAVTGKVGDTEAATPEGEGKELTAELNKAIGPSRTRKAAP
jgi:uncharacterized membrane protein YkoI